jgi:hypothetical protein|tara:strand:+ start:166 stop:348 length:183 start_codon:yes stop_codon:yes gene_type:complete
MKYLIKKDFYHWVAMFSTLAEAQTRFDELKAENPELDLQILLKKKSLRKGWFRFTTKIGE